MKFGLYDGTRFNEEWYQLWEYIRYLSNKILWIFLHIYHANPRTFSMHDIATLNQLDYNLFQDKVLTDYSLSQQLFQFFLISCQYAHDPTAYSCQINMLPLVVAPLLLKLSYLFWTHTLQNCCFGMIHNSFCRCIPWLNHPLGMYNILMVWIYHAFDSVSDNVIHEQDTLDEGRSKNVAIHM